MSMTFGCIDLTATAYIASLNYYMLNPVPIDQLQKVYRDYCKHKNFHSVMPMVPGRFLVPGTEVFGYYGEHGLQAWSMYRIWDYQSVVCDHHAWDYRVPQLRLGRTSLENECAVYRDRGFKFMYFESVESYMYSMQGFKTLGPIE